MECLRSIGALLLTAMLCSCGGAANSPTALPPAATTPNSGTSATANYLLTGRAQSLSLPFVSGCSGRVTLPIAAGSGTTSLTLTTSLSAPAQTQSASRLRTQSAGELTFLCYVTLNVSNTLTFSTLPGFTVTVAPAISTAAPQQFFYAISDPTASPIALKLRTEGPAAVTGQTLTFDPASDALTLLAHTNYIFAFYSTFAPMTKTGKLYVANTRGNSLSIFDTTHGNAVVSPQIVLDHRPFGLAFSASGKLYIATTDPYILTYSVVVIDTANGNAALTPITGGGLYDPSDVAIGTNGKLYVVDGPVAVGFTYTKTVSIFDTAHGNAVLPSLTGTAFTGGVAIDDARGRLYVAGFADSSSISVFDALHGNAPLPPITGGGLNAPGGLALDARGRLYVTNGGNEVLGFDTAHGNVPLPSITGLANSRYVAIDTSGKLYVENSLLYSNPVFHYTYSVRIFDTTHNNAELTPIPDGGFEEPAGLAVR